MQTSKGPVYLEHVAGICGRHGAYIFKDGKRFYRIKAIHFNSQSINLACYKQGRVHTCKFGVTLKVLNIFDRTAPGFYDPSNFLVSRSKNQHTCDGFSTKSEAIF